MQKGKAKLAVTFCFGQVPVGSRLVVEGQTASQFLLPLKGGWRSGTCSGISELLELKSGAWGYFTQLEPDAPNQVQNSFDIHEEQKGILFSFSKEFPKLCSPRLTSNFVRGLTDRNTFSFGVSINMWHLSPFSGNNVRHKLATTDKQDFPPPLRSHWECTSVATFCDTLTESIISGRKVEHCYLSCLTKNFVLLDKRWPIT